MHLKRNLDYFLDYFHVFSRKYRIKEQQLKRKYSVEAMASPSPGKKAKKSQDSNKYIPWLLAAIAKVKGQKQRPDETRICHVMAVAYGVPEEEALVQLGLAVKSGAILRLESKGKSSYKDPAVHAGVKGMNSLPLYTGKGL